MAFALTGLSRVSGANSDAGTMWMYSTADAIATVIAVDYFLEVTNQMNINDIIWVISSTGGTPAVTITYVNASTAATIDVVDGLLVPATDT